MNSKQTYCRRKVKEPLKTGGAKVEKGGMFATDVKKFLIILYGNEVTTWSR